MLRCSSPVLGAGKHAIVRVPVGRFDMASRALDFGAEAVIAPMVNSVEDAQRFAAAMKYPPLGERSWGPTFAAPRHGSKDPSGLAARKQRPHRFLRHDRDPRGGRRPGRHPGHARHRRHLPRACRLLHRLDQGRDGQLDAGGDDGDGGRRSPGARGRPASMPASTSPTRRSPAVSSRWAIRLLATGSEHQLIAAGAAGLLADLQEVDRLIKQSRKSVKRFSVRNCVRQKRQPSSRDRNCANTIVPSGHGPKPESALMCPASPASMNSEPHAAAMSSATSKPQ